MEPPISLCRYANMNDIVGDLFVQNELARNVSDKMDQMRRDDHENHYATKYSPDICDILELKEDFDEPAALEALNSRMCELRCVPAPDDEGLVHPMARVDGKKMCECCHAAFYCSRECQRTHWVSHKQFCANGLARKYRGETTWIASVLWTDDSNSSRICFPLCLHYTYSVDDVKRKIRRRFGVPLGAQILTTSGGLTLDDDDLDLELMETGTLADFGVVRGSVICFSAENCAVPRSTCESCRQCIGGACRLEHGPDAAAAHLFPEVRASIPEVGRNDPCPCGSGKKYKKCCGR